MNYSNNKRTFQNSGVPFRNNNYAQYPQQQQYSNVPQTAKKSGATYTKMRKGKHEGLIAVNAWRKTSTGIMKASCFPVDGVIHVGKDKGHEFMRYVVDISNSNTGMSQTLWCLMRLDTKMIVINELSLVISPNGNGMTASGKRVTGYFGRNYKTR